MKISLPFFLIGLVVTAHQSASQNTKFDATSVYTKENFGDFTVFINPQVIQNQAKAIEVRLEIERQLKNIKDVVPDEKLAKVYKVRIWVEWGGSGGATFHPSADWLRDNGYNPEKAGDIEISNTEKFLEHSLEDQPWLLLHEIAHAYHFHVLGYDHPGIQKAFEKARDGGTYNSVCHIDGTKKKAYAVDRLPQDRDKPQEYFAELTEAYFGRNDFFPFTREKLKLHDPDGYKVLSDSWGEPKSAPTNRR